MTPDVFPPIVPFIMRTLLLPAGPSARREHPAMTQQPHVPKESPAAPAATPTTGAACTGDTGCHWGPPCPPPSCTSGSPCRAPSSPDVVQMPQGFLLSLQRWWNKSKSPLRGMLGFLGPCEFTHSFRDKHRAIPWRLDPFSRYDNLWKTWLCSISNRMSTPIRSGYRTVSSTKGPPDGPFLPHPLPFCPSSLPPNTHLFCICTLPQLTKVPQRKSSCIRDALWS